MTTDYTDDTDRVLMTTDYTDDTDRVLMTTDYTDYTDDAYKVRMAAAPEGPI